MRLRRSACSASRWRRHREGEARTQTAGPVGAALGAAHEAAVAALTAQIQLIELEASQRDPLF